MRVLWTLPWFVLLIIAADAGYYKIRPPPPPPPPPGSVHYGPHPPSSRYHRPSPRYPPPPAPYHPSHHHHHHPSRPPTQPVKSASQRYHQHWPLPPPKPVFPPPPPKPVYPPPAYSWKNYNTFQAPIVKESFSTPQSTYVPTYFKDDERGPIHTIPAPNLAPLDKYSSYYNPGYNQGHYEYGYKSPQQSTTQDLAAVLKHGLTKVNVPQPTGYQIYRMFRWPIMSPYYYQYPQFSIAPRPVTEDPSLHQPNSDAPSFFAPDPDPEVPALKIPPATDPHSLPTNGQVPLDLYLQKEAEKNAAPQQLSHNQESDKLTAQELFKLLNYDPANPVGLIPQTQLQQHVLQPNVQFYNPVVDPQVGHVDNSQSLLTHQQSNQQQFAPQYQSFNYDEQTQQGAYGSDSFPHSSINLNVNGRNELSYGNQHQGDHDLVDNDVEGSDKVNSYDRASENEIVHPKPEERKILSSSKDVPESPKNQANNKETGPGASTTYSSSSSLQSAAEKPATNDNQNEAAPAEQSRSMPEPAHTSPPPQRQDSGKPDDNVQLHKSIQIYENTYATNEDLIQKEIKNLNEYNDDYTDEEKIIKGMIIGRPVELRNNQNSNNENSQYNDSVPYGSRIRPKRF